MRIHQLLRGLFRLPRLIQLPPVLGLLIAVALQTFTVPAAAQTPFALISPTAGAVLQPGQPATVQWTGGDLAWSVDVMLIDVALNQVVAAAARNVPNSGGITWTFPATLPNGNKTCGRAFVIYVQNVQATSWAYGPQFRAAVCPMALTAPSVGAVVVAGQPVAIQWTGGDPQWSVAVSLIDVALNQVVASVAANVPNSGSMTWNFPTHLANGSSTCGRSYVFYVQNTTVTNWAYGPQFTTAPCPFTVSSPPAGHLLGYGQPLAIAWSGGDPLWHVNIYLIEVAPGNYARLAIAPNVPNSGALHWTFPADFPVAECGRQYVIYVENVQRTAWSYGARIHGPNCPPPNQPPTADAGPSQSIRAGATVNLDGSGSFDDNTATAALRFAWTFTSRPAGSTATLHGPDTVRPSFVADKAGTYGVRLVVTDEAGLQSTPSEVVISSLNQAPTANAGADQIVVVGQVAQLNGSASTDPDRDVLHFSWSFASIPPGSTAALSGSNTAMPSFLPDMAGSYVVSLMVSDPFGQGTPDTVELVAVTAATYVEQSTLSASKLLVSLDTSQTSTSGNQRAFGKFLTETTRAIGAGDTRKAIDMLNQAITRTDGCERNGVPDRTGQGRDWITDCSAQASMLAHLRAARAALIR